jgi:DNA replication protein DnaC
MDASTTLRTLTRRLKLSPILATLPDRVAYARKAQLTHEEFLELVLQDEVDRREALNLQLRLRRAQFSEEQTLEGFDWDAPVTFDRERVKELFGLGFLARKEDVILMGHPGVGKTFLASALGHAACRAGKKVLFLRADVMLKELLASRADCSTERALRRLIAPDLLIVDDFGLKRLDATASCDLYEVIIQRHRTASTIVTSNRAIEEWIPLFDDPLLASSALDRLAHNAHQIVIEGETYRSLQGPARRNRTGSTSR